VKVKAVAPKKQALEETIKYSDGVISNNQETTYEETKNEPEQPEIVDEEQRQKDLDDFIN